MSSTPHLLPSLPSSSRVESVKQMTPPSLKKNYPCVEREASLGPVGHLFTQQLLAEVRESSKTNCGSLLPSKTQLELGEGEVD